LKLYKNGVLKPASYVMKTDHRNCGEFAGRSSCDVPLIIVGYETRLKCVDISS
jgi:hypothetical protein